MVSHLFQNPKFWNPATHNSPSNFLSLRSNRFCSSNFFSQLPFYSTAGDDFMYLFLYWFPFTSYTKTSYFFFPQHKNLSKKKKSKLSNSAELTPLINYSLHTGSAKMLMHLKNPTRYLFRTIFPSLPLRALSCIPVLCSEFTIFAMLYETVNDTEWWQKLFRFEQTIWGKVIKRIKTAIEMSGPLHF